MKFSATDRHILVISGEQGRCLAYANEITQNLNAVEIRSNRQAQSYLGQEIDAVIFNAYQQSESNKYIDVNAFGAITGTIRGGGFFLLLKPNYYPDSSMFLKRFEQCLKNHSSVYFIDAETTEKMVLPKPKRIALTTTFATKDQQKTVTAIKKVFTGHRRRPLVIISDRGRGKSSALGMAAAELTKQGTENIIISAPSKKIASTAFHHAEENGGTLTFYSPDELYLQKPKASLVLIDEAAAIPLPLLEGFLQNYSRIVFASTQHGYEGSGRGFAINFRKTLDKETPEWKLCKLKTPIRWSENDSLEQFTFDALLLNAEAATPQEVINTKISSCSFNRISKLKLIKNNNKLKQLFGLLISAHYQTKPSDLLQLLDDDLVNVYCLESKNSIIAVALVVSEGSIDDKYSSDIFSGKRRLNGHLVAQSLSSNIGIKSAIKLSGERISRIAVHSELQGRGFGSHLLNSLIEQSQSDYLSTSFGATSSLLSFWQKAGFKPVHIGIKRDASSGAHSVTMLYPRTNAGIKLTEEAQRIYASNFPQSLTDSLSELESEIVYPLLSKYNALNLSETDKERLDKFAHGSRGYENSLYLIWDIVYSEITRNKKLSETEIKLLIIKVMQKHSWKETVEKIRGVVGKKQALESLRKAIGKLL